jgi:hypothetical protein
VGAKNDQKGGGQGKEASVLEASYRASLKLLTLAGVRLRQHCLERTVMLSGTSSRSS